MKSTIDQLRKLLITHLPSKADQGDLDYKQLGVIWEEMVHAHIDNHEEDVISAIGLKRSEIIKISYSEIFLYPLNKQFDEEERNYGIFDVLITTIDNLPDYIIEIKLGPGNLSLKEMKYLYYKPNSILVTIFLFPTSIDFPDEIFDSTRENLEDLFNRKYKPVSPFKLKKHEMKFLGSSDIGIKDISMKKLRKYLDRRVTNISRLLYVMYNIYPKYLIMDDLCTLTGLYHNYIRRILRIFDNYGLIEVKTGDTLDIQERVVVNSKHYRLTPQFVSHKSSILLIKDLVKHYSITIPQITDFGRTYTARILRDNDCSILCYLSHFPGWISVPDLLENVSFTSQGELRRRLESLVNQDRIRSKDGYLVDLHNTKTKSYSAHFYKLSETYTHEECSSNQNTPTRYCSSLNLSRNELLILLFLQYHRIVEFNPVTISDLASSLDFSQSMTLMAVKRMADQEDYPLKTKQGWVLSHGKIIRLRSSPVVYLDDQISFTSEDFPFEIPALIKNMQILDVPLTPNERIVIEAIRDGHTSLDDLVEVIQLNSIPRSNKSMINSIIKRLSNESKMQKRDLPSLLTLNPLSLTRLALSIL